MSEFLTGAKINTMFEVFEGTVIKELTEEFINVLENTEENSIAIEMAGYDEITSEYFLNKIVEVQKVRNPEKLVIGSWPLSCEQSSGVLDLLIQNKELFNSVKSLYVGDMTYEACEISWIIQDDYAEFLENFDNLEHLAIRGSEGLAFSKLDHKNLKSLEIITGGLSAEVIRSIADGNLPNLEKLMLYIGVDEYGFDGSIEDIKYLMDNLHKFPKLKTLGILNSEIQNDIVKTVVPHSSIKNLEVLDLSYGCLTDIGAKVILENKSRLSRLKMLVLKRSFLSQKYFDELSKLDINVDLTDCEIVEVDWDNITEEELNDLRWDLSIWPLYTE